MQRVLFAVLILFVTVLDLQVGSSLCNFEGTLGSPVEDINNMNFYAAGFIPYNPVMLRFKPMKAKAHGAYRKMYPYGMIFAFEPQPKAYSMLAGNMQLLKNVSTINLALNDFNGTASLWGDGPQASLLFSWDKKFQIDVPCVVLDDWCKHNDITHIDFLRLDAGGLEWQILQISPEILKTVLVNE